MASFAVKKPIAVEIIDPTKEPRRKGAFYYRFFNKAFELYWCFYLEPTEKSLTAVCKALRLPNYEEVDEIEFQKGHR